MKMPIRVALAMLVSCSLIASTHAVTFDVFKATGTFTGSVTGTNDQNRAILIPFELNTKKLINLARGRPLKATVPANEVLAGAGDAAAMASFDLNTVADAAQRLIVYDKNAQTVLATILICDTSTVRVAENRILNAFKRIGFAKTDVQATGTATNGLNSGILEVSGTLTREIVPAGAPPRPTQINKARGVIELVDAGTAKTFFITKSVFTVTGQRLGQFTE